jgi:hypothetical protein
MLEAVALILSLLRGGFSHCPRWTSRRSGKLGEASIKRRAHARLLSSFPWCIYCGGIYPADTIEHMPPIQMFRGKQRPKGLEFPSCKACNNGTSKSDLVACLVGRFSPDGTTELEGTEFRKLLTAVSNNVPGVLQEMQLGRAGQKLASKGFAMPPGSGLLRANGPLVTKHMRIFGQRRNTTGLVRDATGTAHTPTRSPRS